MQLQVNNIKKNKKSQEIEKYLKRPTEKKLKSDVFGKYMEDFTSMAMKSRIAECGNFIGFLKTVDSEVRLDGGNFCNNRFCPMCAWRKARKDGYLLQTLMAYINKIHKKEFIFLTLTAPNVQANKLSEEIDDFNESWKRMTKLKQVSAINKGFIRKLEVTYQGDEYVTKENKRKYENLSIGTKLESYNTYHPHFHVLLAVNRSYFTDKDYYIPRDEWLSMWQSAKRDSSITQVDIRRAKMDDFKSVLEIATYSAKASEYLLNANVFKVFYNGLKGRQLITFNGLFKDTLKAFKNGDLEEFQTVDQNVYVSREWYKWFDANYVLERADDVLIENLDKIYKNEIEID